MIYHHSQHPCVAIEYEKLKLSFRHQYEYDREGYAESTADFKKRVMKNKILRVL